MKSFSPSSRMKAVRMPPVARIMQRISELRSCGRPVLGMAQAVPWYSPPEHLLAELALRMNDPLFHRYSPDPGFPATRKAVAQDLRDRRGIDMDPGSEIHLTCGASQAFLSALLATASHGERVAMLEPYYFDHVFAVQFSDLDLLSIPLSEEDGRWAVPMDRLCRVLEEEDVRALVVVNPGNPTGMVIPDGQMKAVAELAEENGTFLIIDETYERFVFTGDGWHPWQSGRPGHVLTIGSFSKSLGMPGWRLGYLFGPACLLEQAIKVQDSVVICPPSPSQLLLELLITEKEWIDEMRRGVGHRLRACRRALEASGSLSWREAGGAFFTLAEYRSSLSAEEAAMYVLEEYGIGTIPGSAFGDAGEGHLRISFGCLAEEEIEPAMGTLSEVSFPC